MNRGSQKCLRPITSWTATKAAQTASRVGTVGTPLIGVTPARPIVTSSGPKEG
jgi:hypothetical protein